MRQRKLNYIIVLFFIMLTSLTASADDFHVTTAQELQTALSTANSNGVDDIVYLAAGTYTGHFSYQPTESQAMTIQAEAGLNPGQVVLDGNGGQILLVSAGANNADLTLQRITIQNGVVSGDGAGLNLATAGDLVISEVTFSNNQAGQGAAVYVDSVNNINISDSIFSGNNGVGSSTGVALFVGTGNNLTFDNNSFVNNTSSGSTSSLLRLGWYTTLNSTTFSNNSMVNNTIGAHRGMLTTGSTNSITITGNTISNNDGTSGEWGAPLFITPSSNGTILVENNVISGHRSKVYSFGYYEMEYRSNVNLTINNNIFSGNRSTSYYGMRVRDAGFDDNVIFTNNTVINNSADRSYPALFIEANDLVMHNNVIADNVSNNESFNGGGAYLKVAGQLDLTNNSITGNQCTGEGGGLFIFATGSVAINAYNNIIWGNTASSGGDDLYLEGTGSSNKHLHYNSIHDYAGTLWDFVSNNIDVDPLFIDSTNDDYHLGAGSLCLDAGLNTAPGIPATDLDGNARISNTTVDLGAYEHSTGDYHPADTNTDWFISAAEFTAYGDSWRTTASPIDIDYVTRAGYLLQNGTPTGTYKNIGGGKPLCWVPEP